MKNFLITAFLCTLSSSLMADGMEPIELSQNEEAFRNLSIQEKQERIPEIINLLRSEGALLEGSTRHLNTAKNLQEGPWEHGGSKCSFQIMGALPSTNTQGNEEFQIRDIRIEKSENSSLFMIYLNTDYANAHNATARYVPDLNPLDSSNPSKSGFSVFDTNYELTRYRYSGEMSMLNFSEPSDGFIETKRNWGNDRELFQISIGNSSYIKFIVAKDAANIKYVKLEYKFDYNLLTENGEGLNERKQRKTYCFTVLK